MRRHIRDVKDIFLSEDVTVFQIGHLGSGHIRFTTEIGRFVIPSTPSDRRWQNNLMSQIRRSKR